MRLDSPPSLRRRQGRMVRATVVGFTLALIVAIGVMAALPPRASAQMGGVLLEELCRKAMRAIEVGEAPEDLDGVFQTAACFFYIAGFIDYAGMATGDARNFCLPPSGIPREQVVRIYLRHLALHPEDMHFPARTVLIAALRAAFPCD